MNKFKTLIFTFFTIFFLNIANAASQINYLYAVNSDGSVAVCQVSSTTGTIGNCRKLDNQFAETPTQIAITSDGAYANIAGHANTVYNCQVDASTGDLVNCAENTQTIDSSIVAITFNPAGNIFYIVYSDNYNQNTILACSQQSTNCNVANQNAISQANSIAISADNKYAYILTGNSQQQLYKCPINQNDGTFSTNCSVQNNLGLTQPKSIVTNPYNSQFAYMVDFNNPQGLSGQSCPINTSNGSFGNCVGSVFEQNFTSPINMTLGINGKYSYIASSNSDNLELCTINNNGSYTGCLSQIGHGAFNKPVALAFRNAQK